MSEETICYLQQMAHFEDQEGGEATIVGFKRMLKGQGKGQHEYV